MDENKNAPQESANEEELDLLLAQFLAEEDDPSQDAQTPPLSDAEMWENIDAEDPSLLFDLPDAPDAPDSTQIGPDEDALAGIALTHPGGAKNGQTYENEPTAVIPPRASQEADTTSALPRQSDDPLTDDTLRELLFEETTSFKDDEFRDTFGEVEEIYSSAPAPAPAPAPQPQPAQETPAPQPREEAPVRKKRPKNKHAYGLLSIPHILTTLIWLALVVAIGASLGRTLWLCASDVLALGRADQTVYVTITKTDTLDTVADKLHRAGLIRYPGLFKLYGKISDIMEDLSIGTYELNTLYDYHALSSAMSEKPAMRVTVDVTIPEGYTCAQIFALLEEKEVCTVQELEQYASTSEFANYWFLEGTPRGSKYCLEGFLFPDTYEFYVDSDAKEVYIKLLAAFDYRFTDTMKEKLTKLNETLAAKMKKNGLDQAYIDAHLMTIREVVIIASMIEKETSGKEDDSYRISSVIYNRLANPSKYPYLNIDAALIYATGDNILTEEDKQADTPYNTYLYAGLIPGPISNPGRASLDAALDPSDTKYYYYVLDPETGNHDFSSTYEEHQAKVDKYKESLAG